MPAVSVSQRKYFGWLEHSPDAAAARKKSDMSHQQMHDFAATPDKGLPQHVPHMADGGKVEKWGQSAFAHAGEKGHSLHATLGVPESKPIPPYRVRAAAQSGNEHTRHMAHAAMNMNKRYYGQQQ